MRTEVRVMRSFLSGWTPVVALVAALLALTFAGHLLFVCLGVLLVGGGEITRRVRSRTPSDVANPTVFGTQSFPHGMSDRL
jgi:hypothetical protein